MYCANCGKKLNDGAIYCDVCGTKVGADVHKGSTIKENIIYGEAFKCPICGEILPSNAVTCPSCGKEIRGRELSKAVQKFNNELNQIGSTTEKVEFIKTYFIPNNKEDVFEFMIMSSSNYVDSYNHDSKSKLADAWLTKVNQCYEKAKFLFANQNDINQITDIYKEITTIKKEKNRRANKFLTYGIILLVLSLILFVVAFVFALRTKTITIPATEGHEATTELDTTDPNYYVFVISLSSFLFATLPVGALLTIIAIVIKTKQHK